MYTFKAKCLHNTQNSTGSHVATFESEHGEVSIPCKDLLFEAGNEYLFSVEGRGAAKTEKAHAKAAEHEPEHHKHAKHAKP